jgi:hypothetical protein
METRGLYLIVITMTRWATDAQVRLDVAEWQDLGSPLSDLVARTIARLWGDRFDCAPNLRAFGRGQEFNMADAQEECLTLAFHGGSELSGAPEWKSAPDLGR